MSDYDEDEYNVNEYEDNEQYDQVEDTSGDYEFLKADEFENKRKEQMFEQRKEYCALAFRFSPEDKDYFVLDSDTMKYLLICQEYYEK